MMANQGNGGLYSKFQQRLRNIRLSRVKRKKFEKENEKYIQEKVQEIREVVGKEPVRISKRVGISESREEVSRKKTFNVDQKVMVSSIDSHILDSNLEKGLRDKDPVLSSKVAVVPLKKNDSLIQEIHENKPLLSQRKKGISSEVLEKNKVATKKLDSKVSNCSSKYHYVSSKIKVGMDSIDDQDRKEELEKLGTQMLERIKSSFEDHLDELDVLMSELYFLEKTQENQLEIQKVKETKKKIYELIDKVNKIIDQYNLYKKNYYMDQLVGIDDNELIDDLIDYRTLLDSASDEKKFVREYKALEEFQQLYVNLKEIREETILLCEKNEDKIEEFDVRDQKYHAIQLGMVHVQDVLESCSHEMERQDAYFSSLMEKINKIDQVEYTTYRLKGFQELVGQSLRYMGLMLLSPLRGILPGIATQTMATRRLVGHLSSNLHMEKVERVRYETINYDSELGHKLTDIGYTSSMIEDTLQDIERLKEDFMLQYDSRIPGYEDTLKKINQIQNYVIRSQNRVEKIKMRLKKSKKLNEEKMVRVRQLNEKVSRS